MLIFIIISIVITIILLIIIMVMIISYCYYLLFLLLLLLSIIIIIMLFCFTIYYYYFDIITYYTGQTNVALLEGHSDDNPFPLESFTKRLTGYARSILDPGSLLLLQIYNRVIIDRPTPATQNALVYSTRR